jgi:hypothetical protein
MSNLVHRLSGNGCPKGLERLLLICGEVTSFLLQQGKRSGLAIGDKVIDQVTWFVTATPCYELTTNAALKSQGLGVRPHYAQESSEIGASVVGTAVALAIQLVVCFP